MLVPAGGCISSSASLSPPSLCGTVSLLVEAPEEAANLAGLNRTKLNLSGLKLVKVNELTLHLRICMIKIISKDYISVGA